MSQKNTLGNPPQDAEFKELYSGLVPKTKAIIMGAQVFSGLTAAFAIAIIVMSNTAQLGFWVGVALASVAALFLVSLIEGGLFHVAPFVFRQLVRGKFTNRYYVGMFVLLFPIVFILASSTTFLSFVGSPYLVEIATPKHETEDLQGLNNTLAVNWTSQSDELNNEKREINERFNDQINSTKKGFKKKIRAKMDKAKQVKKTHPQWSAGLEKQAKEIDGRMSERIAEIKEARNNELAKITEVKTTTLLAHNSHKKLIVSTAINGNQNRETKRANLVSSSGGFVKYFAVFCTLITLFGLLLLELHEAGKEGLKRGAVSLNPFQWFQAGLVSSFDGNQQKPTETKAKPRNLKPETVETETVEAAKPIPGITTGAILETVSIDTETETAKIAGIETAYSLKDCKKKIQQYGHKLKNDTGNAKTNKIRIAQFTEAVKQLS